MLTRVEQYRVMLRVEEMNTYFVEEGEFPFLKDHGGVERPELQANDVSQREARFLKQLNNTHYRWASGLGEVSCFEVFRDIPQMGFDIDRGNREPKCKPSPDFVKLINSPINGDGTMEGLARIREASLSHPEYYNWEQSGVWFPVSQKALEAVHEYLSLTKGRFYRSIGAIRDFLNKSPRRTSFQPGDIFYAVASILYTEALEHMLRWLHHIRSTELGDAASEDWLVQIQVQNRSSWPPRDSKSSTSSATASANPSSIPYPLPPVRVPPESSHNPPFKDPQKIRSFLRRLFCAMPKTSDL